MDLSTNPVLLRRSRSESPRCLQRISTPSLPKETVILFCGGYALPHLCRKVGKSVSFEDKRWRDFDFVTFPNYRFRYFTRRRDASVPIMDRHFYAIFGFSRSMSPSSDPRAPIPRSVFRPTCSIRTMLCFDVAVIARRVFLPPTPKGYHFADKQYCRRFL